MVGRGFFFTDGPAELFYLGGSTEAGVGGLGFVVVLDVGFLEHFSKNFFLVRNNSRRRFVMLSFTPILLVRFLICLTSKLLLYFYFVLSTLYFSLTLALCSFFVLFLVLKEQTKKLFFCLL